MKTENIIKKSIQSLLIILMLFIIALTFSACAQVRVMTITNADDTIDEIVTVSISVEEILNSGYNVSELKLDIETKSQAQAQTMKDNLNDKIFKDLLRVGDAESVAVLNSFLDGISVIKSDWKDNTYAIGIRFKNIDVYGSHHLSAFVTPGNVKFILMSQSKTVDTKSFFDAVYEDYIKIILNPFYELQTPIQHDQLTAHIKQLLKQ